MKQFLAGYILDSLIDVFENKSSRKKAFKELAKWCAHYQIESKSGFEENKVDYTSSIAVLINLIQRGTPTLLNKFAIDFIVKRSTFLTYDEENESAIVVNLKPLTEEAKELIFRSLHLIDPRLNVNGQNVAYMQSWEKLGSSFEEDFIFNDLPNALGSNGAALVQLIARQRAITNIVKGAVDIEKVQAKVKNNFVEQRTDFSIEFPYISTNQPKGIVIEIDGSHHLDDEQLFIDTERDKAVAASGWHNTLRIKTSEFGTPQFGHKINNILVPAINNEFINNCKANYKTPIWNSELGKEIIQLSLIPFGVARIQRTILEALAQGILKPNKEAWKLGVLERDVPCARLAIDDILKLIEAINSISSETITIPKIELSVFSTNEFIKSNFQDKNTKSIHSFSPTELFDLVIDIAILDRTSNSIINSNAKEIINIRSIHYIDSQRTTASAELIKHKPFCINHNDSGIWKIKDVGVKEGLEYLLQSVFRKKSFMEGQLPIMHNALQCKSVIGLLPTGGGKSLTYQLSALLQPGICLVIDPIRSLMKDQVDGLLRNNIDSCVYINSTLQGIEKRKSMRKLADGEVQFVFVSPERLQMEEFRNLLEDMFNAGIYFSYCVIDEAHCVSEWGHDFRTAYLRLGENAIKYCKTKNMEHLPLFGLTATASYDVLADVQRELSGNDEKRRLTEDAIIRSEYSKRNELQYVIEDVTFPTGAMKTIWDLKKELGAKKQERVIRLLNDIPDTINEFLENPTSVFSTDNWELNENGEKKAFEKMQIKDYSPHNFYGMNNNAALIFCPHKSGIFGVTDKFKLDQTGAPISPRKGYFDNLSTLPFISAGYFMGSGDDNDIAKVIQAESFENQDKFINNELNLMVATKAFGMGIDKENIRYTIHTNYPGSIESYVQEAGRAGRDRKMALSYILFNDQEVSIPGEDEKVDHDLDVNMYFHKNSFKGVAKELAVLDELLTEIYFPDRTFELENLINNEFETNVKCNYWEGGHQKRLYINFNFTEPLGYLDLNTLKGFPGGTINTNLSNQILPLLKNYILNLGLIEPVHLWIQRSDKQIGIEQIRNSIREGDKFNLTVGFFNNITERIEMIASILRSFLHPNFSNQLVRQIRSSCNNSNDFIELIGERYVSFTGNTLDFEKKCFERDGQFNRPSGETLKRFHHYFNGYRDKMDTEKAIYRLSMLGIIDDYTVNFSSNTFSLIGTKKSEKEYKENLKGYLLKYYSEKTTRTRLEEHDSIDESTPIRKSLNFLVNFVYNEIEKKRKRAISDMKEACRFGLENDSVELKEFIDLYFNSKYARREYLVNDKNASLFDLLVGENKTDDNIEYVRYFMEVMDLDKPSSQIDNYKHLRGACTRLLRSQPDSYTLLLLNAFALYMLEYKNPRYLQEAETLLLKAFASIQEKEPDWSETKLENTFNTFTEKLIDKNSELLNYMETYGFTFDFDSIMITRLLKPLQQANSTLRKLNEILN